MIKSTAIDIIRAFTKKEIKDFSYFIISPFHNTNRSVVKLFGILKKYHPDFENKNLTKELLFGKIYPYKNYNEQTMKSALFNLGRLAEEFLLLSALGGYGFEKAVILLKEFTKRTLEKPYYKKLNEAEKILDKQSVYEVDFLERKSKLETIKADYVMTHRDVYKHEKELIRRTDFIALDFILKLIYSLEDMNLAKYELNLKLEKNITELIYTHINLKGLLENIKEINNPYYYVFELKYYELNSIMNLDTDNYILYKNLVFENIDKFNWQDKYNTLGVMSSICIMGNNKGIHEFRNEQLDVCKKMLDEGSYSYNPNEHPTISRYLNMLSDFIKFKQWDYLDRLIEEFGSKLSPEYRESIISYSRMSELFQKKKFEEALSYNHKIDYNHSLIIYNTRILLIKVYYELGYIEELLSLLDANQKFFSGITHYSERRTGNTLNFIKYLKKIILNKTNAKNKKMAELLIEIKSRENINSKEWLIEKIEELNNK